APSAEDRAPSAEDRAPSAADRAPSAADRAPSAEDRAPSAEDRAPSAEDRAPSADKDPPRRQILVSMRLRRVGAGVAFPKRVDISPLSSKAAQDLSPGSKTDRDFPRVGS